MNNNKVVAIFFALVTFCCAQNAEEPIAILRFDNEGPNPDGSYKYSYETANGITVEEQGVIKDAGTENEAAEVRGSYQYTAPDGTLVSVTYIANENGFQPQGTHIAVAGIAPDLQQRMDTTSSATTTTPAAAVISSSEQPLVAAVEGEEQVAGNGNGNGNGEVASEAEASLFRPVYRARGGNSNNNYVRAHRYQRSL